MRLTVIVAAVMLAGVVVAGCDGSAEPAPPPTSEEALTTATQAPAEEAATTEAEPTTEAPVAGPPEMPAEAMEQTEAGAEAFVEHYFEVLNATGTTPESGVLELRSSDNCRTCAEFEGAVQTMETNGERYDNNLAEMRNVTAIGMGDTAVATASVDQLAVNVVDSSGTSSESFPAQSGVEMEFHLVRSDETWLVDKIFLVEQQ